MSTFEDEREALFTEYFYADNKPDLSNLGVTQLLDLMVDVAYSAGCEAFEQVTLDKELQPIREALSKFWGVNSPAQPTN